MSRTARRVPAAIVLLLLATSSAWAAPPTIAGPDAAPPYRLVRLEAVGDFDAATFLVLPLGLADGSMIDGRHYVFVGPPGDFQIVLTTTKDNVLSQVVKTVTIGGAPPVPPGPEPPQPPVPDPPGPEPEPEPEPEPPGPGPGPTPPTPVPPQPTPAGPFAGVVLYETEKPYPPDQQAVIQALAVREYFAAHGLKDAAGRPLFRFWDDDYKPADLATQPQVLQDAYARGQADHGADNAPWLVLIDGPGRVLSRALPGNVADTVAALKQFAGE